MESCSLLCLPHPKGPMGLVVERVLGQKWSKLESRKSAAATLAAPRGSWEPSLAWGGAAGSGKQPHCWGHSLIPNVGESQGREAKAERKRVQPILGEVRLWTRRMGPG